MSRIRTWAWRLGPLLVLLLVAGAVVGVRARGLSKGKRALKKARAAAAALGLPTTAERAPSRSADAAALATLLARATDGLERRHAARHGEIVRPSLHAAFLRGDDLAARGAGSAWQDTGWTTDAELTAIVAGRAGVLGQLEAHLLDADRTWTWDDDRTRALLLQAHDAAALLGLRALSGTGSPWRAVRAARRLVRALRGADTPELLTRRLAIAHTADEAIAALLRRGIRPPADDGKALLAELADHEPADLLVRVHHRQLVSYFADVDAFLRDGAGPIALDYLHAQGGTRAGLWLRQGLGGEALAGGARLIRLAAEAAARRDPRRRLADAAEVASGWRRWRRDSGTRELFRYGPLGLEQRLQIDRRRRLALSVALALALHAAAHDGWPAGLTALVPDPLPALAPDPLSGALPAYGRTAADTVTLTLPPTALLPERRRTWQVRTPN